MFRFNHNLILAITVDLLWFYIILTSHSEPLACDIFVDILDRLCI